MGKKSKQRMDTASSVARELRQLERILCAANNRFMIEKESLAEKDSEVRRLIASSIKSGVLVLQSGAIAKLSKQNNNA